MTEKQENPNQRVIENAALITASPLLLAIGGCCLMPVVLVIGAMIFSVFVATSAELLSLGQPKPNKPPVKTQAHQVNVKKK